MRGRILRPWLNPENLKTWNCGHFANMDWHILKICQSMFSKWPQFQVFQVSGFGQGRKMSLKPLIVFFFLSFVAHWAPFLASRGTWRAHGDPFCRICGPGLSKIGFGCQFGIPRASFLGPPGTNSWLWTRSGDPW